jgi:hypothetical protein
MDVDDNVAKIRCGPLVILGRTKDRTGENHASAISPWKQDANFRNKESILVQRELTRFVACGRRPFKLPSLAPTIRHKCDSQCHT